MLNGRIGLFTLAVMIIFMLLAQFGAISVPFVVWIIWSLIGTVLAAIGR